MCPDNYNAHQILQASFGDYNVTPVKEFKTEHYETLSKLDCHFAQSSSMKSMSRNYSAFRVTTVLVFVAQPQSTNPTRWKYSTKQLMTRNPEADAEMIKETINELNEVIRQFGETFAELKHNFEVVKQEVSEIARRMIEKIHARE